MYFVLGSDNDDLYVAVSKTGRKLKANVCERQMRRRRRAEYGLPEESPKRITKTMMRRNAMTLLECSTAWAFRWYHGAFYCSYCDVKFVDTQPLRDHVKCYHLNEPPFEIIFSKLKENNMVKVDVGELYCRFCNVGLNSVGELKYHIVCHGRSVNEDYSDGVLPFKLNDDGFLCQVCSLRFLSFPKLNEHMNEHYTNYVCDTCGKGFVSKTRFRTHAHDGHASYLYVKGNFPCKLCGEVFSTRTQKANHRYKIHHQGKRYNCPRCPEGFTTYNARLNHLIHYHAERLMEYLCEVCGKSFNSQSKRSAHRRLVHASKDQTSYICLECSASFVTKSKLARHMKTHGK